MTEDEIVRVLHQHFEKLFPKVCPNCDRRFDTLRDYILNTRRVKGTISYDAQMGNWEPAQPIGAIAFANCPCGNTLALTSTGMPLAHIHAVLKWLKHESERRGISSDDLTDYLRDEVRKRVLSNKAQC